MDCICENAFKDAMEWLKMEYEKEYDCETANMITTKIDLVNDRKYDEEQGKNLQKRRVVNILRLVH